MAGEHTVKNGNLADWSEANILESYFYCNNNKFVDNLVTQIDKKRFMLDSGAFTFMSNAKITTDWDRYVQEYAEYILKHDIKLFFELDIDSVVGISEVEKLRNKLELLTRRKSIPVWHKSRGKQYWLDMCKEYNYVAIGGIVSGEIKRSEFNVFPWFIKTAHDSNAKIHALGFTNLKGLQTYRFDSIDSTAWLYGNRGGYLYKFDGKTIKKIDKPAGTKLKSRAVAAHNFNEWVKFGKYMESR